MNATVALCAGEVAYAMAEAEVEIDRLIEMLNDAKEDGATHVVLESGNYRGAKWQHLPLAYEWVD